MRGTTLVRDRRCSCSRPFICAAISGSGSVMMGSTGDSDVFRRCCRFLRKTAPLSVSTVYDRSSSLAVTWALRQDLSPSLNGFILMTSPSDRLGRSFADHRGPHIMFVLNSNE